MNNNVMGNKTYWIGWIVVLVVTQVYNYAVHEIGLSGTYESLASVFRPEAQMMSMMWMMFVGDALYLLLFCYIFTRGHEGKGVMEGVRYGVLMGLFLAIPTVVTQYVVYPLTGELAAIWFVAYLAGLIIAGAIFAAIYKPA